MLHKIKKCWLKLSPMGQNMTEYLIVFVGIVVALVAAAGPTGVFTKKIQESLDTAVTGTKCLALEVCYDPAGCPAVCGNDCCEPGENIGNCAADCSLCLSDADCDDGYACNGIETCDPATGCQVGAGVCANCGFGINHGECGDFYDQPTVPYGGDCGGTESRCCDNGVLDGNSAYDAPIPPGCSVLPPANCGPGFPHGTWQDACEAAIVDCGEICKCEQRYCNNGVLEGGTNGYTVLGGCTVTGCTNCADPSGGPDIPHGQSRAFYLRPVVECWTVCSAEQEARTCDDGSLSGSYTVPSCAPASCDDGVICTDDVCNTGVMLNFGCTNTPNDSLCDDNRSCTGIIDASVLPLPRNSPASDGDDWCDAAADCQFFPVDARCDDSVGCTADICDAAAGSPPTGCVITPVDAVCTSGGAQDDGISCTDDWCHLTADCQHDPNNANCTAVGECADGTCDPTLDCQYVANDVNCDDGVGCTNDWCEDLSPNFICHRDPNNASCADTTACTVDFCDAVLDCQNIPDDGQCDDGIDCTGIPPSWLHILTPPRYNPAGAWDDFCWPGSGCIYWPQNSQCDDGNLCNGAEICNASVGCQAGVPLNCNDGVACTDDSCVPATGCLYTPNNANCPSDGIACTIETCDQALGCQTAFDDGQCNDGINCTGVPDWFLPSLPPPRINPAGVMDDFCWAGVGCVYWPQGSYCQDGNVCNGMESCSAVAGCQSGTPLVCNDSVACTSDSCIPSIGCRFVPNHGNCTDAYPCTRNNCDPVVGCQFIPNDARCNDGVPCTGWPEYLYGPIELIIPGPRDNPAGEGEDFCHPPGNLPGTGGCWSLIHDAYCGPAPAFCDPFTPPYCF